MNFSEEEVRAIRHYRSDLTSARFREELKARRNPLHLSNACVDRLKSRQEVVEEISRVRNHAEEMLRSHLPTDFQPADESMLRTILRGSLIRGANPLR